MKRLLLLFIFVLCSFAPAFSEEKAPTNQELNYLIHKQSLEIKNLDHNLKEHEGTEQFLYSHYSQNTENHITFYSWFITLVIGIIVGIMGVVIPINQRRRTERMLKGKIAEITTLKEAVDTQSANIKLLEAKMEASEKKTAQDSKDATKAANKAKASALFSEALNEKDSKKEIELYTKAIELNPEFAEAYVNRGCSRYEQGDYTEAMADYNEAIRLNPKDADAHYNRGYMYDEQKEYAKAIADYNNAIELNPKFANAHNNRRIAYEKLAAREKDPAKKAEYEDNAKADRATCDKLRKG